MSIVMTSVRADGLTPTYTLTLALWLENTVIVEPGTLTLHCHQCIRSSLLSATLVTQKRGTTKLLFVTCVFTGKHKIDAFSEKTLYFYIYCYRSVRM